MADLGLLTWVQRRPYDRAAQRWILGLLLGGLVPVGSVYASPVKPGAAIAHFDQGTTAFAEGRYADALKEFQISMTLEPSPNTRIKVARCYKALGQIGSAFVQFHRTAHEAQDRINATGEARYAEELEKTYYNHLAAAQRPDGAAWAYFTALDGQKPYKTEQNCCTSSGPRGWAMLPAVAYMTSEDGVVINFLATGTASLKVEGETVHIRQQTAYPADGGVAITVTVPKPMKFALRVRVPAWSAIAGFKTKPGDYYVLRQTWSRTQTIALEFAVPTRVVSGEGSNAGKLAVVRGPQVLAVDAQFNPGLTPQSVQTLISGPPLRR